MQHIRRIKQKSNKERCFCIPQVSNITQKIVTLTGLSLVCFTLLWSFPFLNLKIDASLSYQTDCTSEITEPRLMDLTFSPRHNSPKLVCLFTI